MTPTGWPMFFCAKALRSRNLNVNVGDAFPYQDINVIRGYGAAYGVPNAFSLAPMNLPYVDVIDVGTPAMQRQITQQALSAKAVKKLMGMEAAA